MLQVASGSGVGVVLFDLAFGYDLVETMSKAVLTAALTALLMTVTSRRR
jgi:hypothetical protein